RFAGNDGGADGYRPPSAIRREQMDLHLVPQTGGHGRRRRRPRSAPRQQRAGRNYGWPMVSYGRDYRGPRMTPMRAGMEDPILFWVPSIATSGLTFYTG